MTNDHEKSRALWNDMAAGWERHRAYMWEKTRHVAEWLVDNADVRAGDTALDLAGGPGESGLLLAERVGPQGRVIETDFAPEMVAVAERAAQKAGAANVETRVLDAEAMDLPDDSVDAIVCRWGFMLMLDPATAFAECRRVLNDGRRLAFSVWGPPEKNPWVTTMGATIAQMGFAPGRDPFGPGGMFSLSAEDTIREMVTGAGFQVGKIEEMPVEWTYESFDEAWDFTTQVAGALASLIKELPEDRVTELRQRLEENYEPFRDGRGLRLPGITLNATVLC